MIHIEITGIFHNFRKDHILWNVDLDIIFHLVKILLKLDSLQICSEVEDTFLVVQSW